MVSLIFSGQGRGLLEECTTTKIHKALRETLRALWRADKDLWVGQMSLKPVRLEILCYIHQASCIMDSSDVPKLDYERAKLSDIALLM